MMMEVVTITEEQMAIEGYSPILAAQTAAAFLIQEGGSMQKLKLVKLLYLAERESIALRMRPIFYDENFSLPKGPAGTNVIDGINGKKDSGTWREYMSAPDANDVVTVNERLVDDDFADLSDAEIGIVKRLSKQFRDFDGDGIRAYTHDRKHVPEYEERSAGRSLITDEAVATALGFKDPAAYARHVAELRKFVRGRGKAERERRS
jgi:uncharacterized phage-associated protein